MVNSMKRKEKELITPSKKQTKESLRALAAEVRGKLAISYVVPSSANLPPCLSPDPAPQPAGRHFFLFRGKGSKNEMENRVSFSIFLSTFLKV